MEFLKNIKILINSQNEVQKLNKVITTENQYQEFIKITSDMYIIAFKFNDFIINSKNKGFTVHQLLSNKTYKRYFSELVKLYKKLLKLEKTL